MKRHSMDVTLFVTVMLLLGIGLMMVFSSSYYFLISSDQHWSYYFMKDLRMIVLGLVAMFATALFPYRLYKRFTPLILVVSIILCILVLTPVGTEINGSQRWIFIGSISIMPSEIAKIAVILFSAHLVERMQDQMKSLTQGLLPFLVLAGVFFALINPQPDLSSAVTVVGIVIVMVFVGGASIPQLAGIGVLGAIGLVAAVKAAPYRMERWLVFLDPFKYSQQGGWQIIQSLYALGSGGTFGVGIGQSVQNKLWLPEPQNDFIFATIGEEFGFIGGAFVILLFLLLIYRGVKIAANAPDLYGSMIATGITAMIGIQVMINIGVATGSMPVTGIPLPYISYGGNATIMLLAGTGILLNVSQYTKKG